MKDNRFKGKKILVTGADGFIGRALIKQLKSVGAQVASLDLKTGTDICDMAQLNNFQRRTRFDVIYHLAALSYVPASWQYPRQTMAVNLLGTLNMLEFCRQRRVGKFIFISTYVYGQPQYLPVNEQHPISPANPYAWSKYIGEKLCEAYHKSYGLKCIILRPFNIYGPAQSKIFLIPSLHDQFKHANKIVVNDLRPRRDFLFIDDMIEALLAAGSYRGKNFVAFNLGSGESHSIRHIIKTIEKISGRHKKTFDQKKRRPGEINDVIADIKNAKKRLKWHPKTNLFDGNKIIWGAE